MARLNTDPNHPPLSGDYNPQAVAFHATKIALVEDIIARRPHAGFKVERNYEDGRTDLTIEGSADDVINLLLTLHHHGTGLLTVEADTDEEHQALLREFGSMPAVFIKPVETA